MARTRNVSIATLALAACIAVRPSVGLGQTAPPRPADLLGEASEYSSVYLPLGHWVYDYLDVLIARGRINSLSPLVRPYRRIDIAAAVLSAEREGQLSRPALAWVDAIEEELAHEVELLRGRAEQEVEFRAELSAGLKALSHTHRDPLRPAGEENVFPTLKLYVSGEAPLVAGAGLARWDNHLLNDPQFPDGRAIERRQCDPLIDDCAYRPDEAYVEVQAPYVRVSFGRMDRNWGLPGLKGMLISDYAYSYDAIGYRFGGERISLSGLYAPFDDFGGDTTRHFATHRFDWRIRDNLHVAIGESVVYGGENRNLEFVLVNPILPWEISGRSGGSERNSLGMAEVWFRIYDDLVAYGAFLVDNTSVGDEASGKGSGFNQFAAAGGLQLPTFMPSVALRGELTVVSSLAYRSRVAFFEYYSLEGIGLAHDRTDAVVLSAQADWFPRPQLILQPRLDVMWKGEDDLIDPFPEDAFTTHERLLVGTVETTVRPSLGGRYHFGLGEVRWDAGANLVKNDEHVEGRDWRLIGVGRLEVELRKRF